MAYQPSPNRIAAQSPGFYRIWHITGDKKRGIEPILPIGRSTFLDGVAAGKYPQPVKLGKRTSAWRKSDILALVESFEPGANMGAA
ncbi:hypothetical protein BJL95_04455 [Methylomonas sp. LWB]|uniref:helix-turn-helix transcriptional regulator n=1 Tax=Methylomonas sp. LWB TaxID=1905845 RepID=UPI0008D9F349|nr:AlpA family phage regulatory protein [Methylomonas sp. LWB]OHX37830.1 hypothetical protein BJL95_04455 [Methylomonas sp. LWB]